MATQPSEQSGTNPSGRRIDGVSTRPTATMLTALAVAVVLATAALAGPAAAAGNTTVTLSPSNASVEPGGNATFEVVVENVTGGVGTYNLTVVSADPAVASVTDIEILGEPSLANTSVGPDGSASALAALLDTDDAGSVTVARAVVTGDRTGSATVSVGVTALADESARSYTVTGTGDATVVVGAPGSTGGSANVTNTSSEDGTDTPGSTAALTVESFGNDTATGTRTDGPATDGEPSRPTDETTTDATGASAADTGAANVGATDSNATNTDTTDADATDADPGTVDTDSGGTETDGNTTAAATNGVRGGTTDGGDPLADGTANETTTSGSGPGFGVAAVGVALVVLALGRSLRRRAR